MAIRWIVQVTMRNGFHCGGDVWTLRHLDIETFGY
jgi:hypothetical protein